MVSGPRLRGRAARLAALLPAGPSRAARTPFVLLVVALLAGGLISLLVLNSSLNEGSFQLDDLKKQATDLSDEEQQLRHDVNGYSAPDALRRRAGDLGMVPGGSPAFLGPDGTVRGVPSAAPAAPHTPGPATSPSSADTVQRDAAVRPSGSPTPTATPGTPAGTPSAPASHPGGTP
ncbi:hypothetical protein [Streptomyces sp. NPDC050560]|uniref:hypothetical protein n=1 Tax=Streptomyces sp. NPDC050560 TaxID=3365630 RepID=UPI0037BA5DAA